MSKAKLSRTQFADLPDALRLAVVTRLFERRHDLTRDHTVLKETVQDHARLLGIHVATLERDQNAAKRAGFIQIGFNYSAANKDLRPTADNFISTLEEPDKFHQLVEALRRELRRQGNAAKRFKALHVVRCGPVTGGPRRRVRHFARLAAPRLVEILKQAKLIGLTWGPTLKCVLDACDAPKTFAPDARVFPLTGATRDIEKEAWISSILVRDLEARRGGRSRGRPLTLQGVWSAVPPKLNRRQRQILINAMISTTDYAKIFGEGKESGLVHNMDTVLTSIGRLEHPWGMGRGALDRIVDLTSLRTLAFGDIGGVLLPRRSRRLNRAERKKFHRIRSSWIGLTANHLGALADRAQSSTAAPGVCVLALGAAKAEVLLCAIELGLVNQAVIDETLAMELARSLHLSIRQRLPINGCAPAGDDPNAPASERSTG